MRFHTAGRIIHAALLEGLLAASFAMSSACSSHSPPPTAPKPAVTVARYELAIQTAFREVSDALNARETYRDQRSSQQALAAADAEAYRLAEMRFRSGVDSYLATLDAQRPLYAAEQQLVAIRQAEPANQVTLYKALGGGRAQHTAAPDRPAA